MDITTFVIGLVILFLGYLVRFHQKLNLVVWFDLDRVHDTKGLSRWVGTHIMIIGLFLMSFGSWEVTSGYPILIGAVIAVIVVYSGLGTRRFLK